MYFYGIPWSDNPYNKTMRAPLVEAASRAMPRAAESSGWSGRSSRRPHKSLISWQTKSFLLTPPQHLQNYHSCFSWTKRFAEESNTRLMHGKAQQCKYKDDEQKQKTLHWKIEAKFPVVFSFLSVPYLIPKQYYLICLHFCLPRKDFLHSRRDFLRKFRGRCTSSKSTVCAWRAGLSRRR